MVPSTVQLDRLPDDGVHNTGVVSVGDVSVLFVSVSVVALPTSVSVLVGRVIVPVFDMVDIIGLVRVLFVSVAVALFFVASLVLSTLLSQTADLSRVSRDLSHLRYCAVVPAVIVFSLLAASQEY